MNIAVTGASGHVGSNLCRELIREGHHVKVLVYHDTKGIEGLNLTLVKGDILDVNSLKELCRDVEIVLHLAARISIGGNKKKSIYRTNVSGPENIIQCCREMGVRRLVHFSSIHAIDNRPADRPLDESWPAVDSGRPVYDLSKSAGEKVIMAAVRSGFDAVVVSPTAIMGPNDFKPSYLGLALIKLYLNKLPMLVPGGYNWVDVRDVVQGAISAALRGRRGEKYLLSGRYLTLKELARMIGDISGNGVPNMVCPSWMAQIGVPFIRLHAKVTHTQPLYTTDSIVILKECNRYIQHSKATKELGFNPRPVEETLADTFEWYKGNGFLP